MSSISKLRTPLSWQQGVKLMHMFQVPGISTSGRPLLDKEKVVGFAEFLARHGPDNFGSQVHVWGPKFNPSLVHICPCLTNISIHISNISVIACNISTTDGSPIVLLSVSLNR